MTEVVGVRFRRAGPIYHFDPAGVEFTCGDSVVVDTSRGVALGRIVTPPKEVASDEISEPLKPVLRQAQPEDLEKALEMKEKGNQALAKCGELVERFHLPMRLLSAEYNLDGGHLTIYFRSEKRVDFRALLRELSTTLKARVELRQMGARDAAKLIGGVGMCGLSLCCASHLSRFEPISMKMARQQDLPLNPANISGVCGRLLCCLSYENEQYCVMKQKLPPQGHTVDTRLGKAKVIGGNPLKETVVVRLESEAIVELPLSEIESSHNNSPQ
ncbi:MAG: stage 0 sporulation family protein [Dehalococcoidia bacterium]